MSAYDTFTPYTTADAEFYIKRMDNLFSKKYMFDGLCQEIADNFYPERADFIVQRQLGTEFASNLSTSFPVQCRTDLGNSIGSMLRPTNKEWFHVTTTRPDKFEANNQAKRWLQQKGTVMRRAMYDRVTNFDRATNQADHDFAAFGQAAMTVELNRKKQALLYRTWHLRDMAWCEGMDGKVSEFFRKWNPGAQQLIQEMNGRVDQKIRDRAEKDPYAEVKCAHIVMPSEYIDGGKKFKEPWVSVYLDIENKYVMEEVGIWNQMYILPRWVTVSGYQYAFSPAVTCALPDARCIQQMMITLLEAGEKAVNPPMIAIQDALKSDVNIYAGGITFADAAYDERLGDVLRPLMQDKSGIPIGVEMMRDLREQITNAFFLNKLSLPPIQSETTAFEIGQRVQEYIRQALPLFGPMETDYNGQLCDLTFDLLLRNGAFGSVQDMPPILRGADIQFRFESPLHDAIDAQKVQQWQQAKLLISDAVALDPTSAQMLDVPFALRDALDGAGTPAAWVRTEQEMAQIAATAAQQQKQQALLQQLSQASAVGESMGRAGESFSNIAAQQNGQPAAAPA